MKVLVVDDEKIKCTALRDDLVDAGYQTFIASCADEGLHFLEVETVDVVVTDLRMAGMDGISFLRRIKENWPGIEVVMITAYATVDNAVEAMKLGAFDYVTKPFESGRLIDVLKKIAKLHAVQAANSRLEAGLPMAAGQGGLVGQSAAMQSVFEAMELAKTSEVPVLIFGETGTGKERVANAIHGGGSRATQPFITIHGVALSPQLMESELFGHEKGSFTGALTGKPGRFEIADGGTIFFDEIDDIPLEVQSKLLRVIEGYPFERVGGIKSLRVDVRFIAASKVDLRKRVAEGKFREDLFYRVSVFPIWLPPLRERIDDVPPLLEHFLKIYGGGKQVFDLDEKVIACFQDYTWPGNVRELQNVVRRILVGMAGRQTVVLDDVPPEIRRSARQGQAPSGDPSSFRGVIEANEKTLLANALDMAGGNQSKAAAAIGMKLSTFRDKLAKHSIKVWSNRGVGAKENGGD